MLRRGGIILSSVATKYQLCLVFHAGSLIVPLSAPTPHGTWESAMNAAFSASTSPAKEAANLALSRNTALGQKRTCAVQNGMSALPPKADIPDGNQHVRWNGGYKPIARIQAGRTDLKTSPHLGRAHSRRDLN